MRKIAQLSCIGVLMSGMPAPAHAHVKWFVDADKVVRDPSVAYHLDDPAVILWISILVAGLILAYVVDRIAPQRPTTLVEKGTAWQGRIIYIFQLIIGLALITTAYRGALMAPHLKEGANLAMILRGFEALVGVLFIFNFWVRAGAFILFMLFFTCAAMFGLLMAMEYINLLGIALFLIFLKSPVDSKLNRHCHLSLPLLRVFTGVALSVLAFSEKLLSPSLALAFLDEHKINFMQIIGFDGFSDRLFILSAGFCELLFGLIFITGLVTRINTVAIALFLVASNAYFFFIGKWAEGTLEIIGHANLFAIAMILIFYGAGGKLRLARPQRLHRRQEIRHVSLEGELVKVKEFEGEPWCASPDTLTMRY